MALRTVVVKYSANVNDVLRGLDQMAKANDKAGGASEGAGKKIDRNAKAALGLALASGVAVARFAEFDAQMSAVAAATGKTGDELDALREAAIRAGADTQYSATEAAQAITELSKAGISAKDILGGGLAGALTLAAAGQMDVAEAAETAATAMTQFGLDGSQVSHVADLLAAGAGKAQGSVSDMGAALKQSGLVAAQTGLSIEETTAGLTAFASAGLIGSDAGTSFKSMLQRLTPQSAEAKRLMDELGISAYDAGGNFVGLEAFAGNLQSALKDLTPEQRNSAMATIFGSDAVRAAAVLYNEGADGIRRWTDEVNQQGFAAQQAATLTDNLKGDLERLGGAFDTVLIQGGSGANDALRTLVQTAETLVEMFGQIPGPVLMGAAAFATIALATPKLRSMAGVLTGPLGGGMTRFRQEMALQNALAPANASAMSRVAGGFTAVGRSVGGLKGLAGGLVGILGGGWGIALSAATIGLGLWAKAQADASQRVKDLTVTLDEQTGALTASSQKVIAAALMEGVDFTTLEKYGVTLKDVTAAVAAGGPAYDALIGKVTDLANTNADAFPAADQLRASMLQQRDAVAQAQSEWKQLDDATRESTAAATVATTAMDLLKAGTSGLGATQMDVKGLSAAFNDEQGRTAEQAREAQAAMDELKQSILDYGHTVSGAINSEIAWQSSIDAASDAVSKNGKTLDLHTPKGRANMQALLGMAQAAREDAVAKAENGASTATLTARINDQRAAFINAAVSMGMSRQKAGELANQLGLTTKNVTQLSDKLNGTPKDTKAKVSTPGATQSQQQVNDLRAEIAQLRGKTVTVDVVATGVGAVQAAINSIQGVTRTVSVRQQRVGQAILAAGGLFPSGSPAVAFAGGGTWSPDIANGHMPHIAPGGTYRVFAERETGGELYAPLANDWRRPRSKALIAETVRRFGGAVTWNATGSISSANRVQQMSGSPSLAGLSIVGTLDTPFGPAQVRGIVQSEIASEAREIYAGVR